MATGPPDMAAGGAPLPAGETCSSLSPTATEAGDDPAASSSSAAAPVAVLDKLAALEVARRAERDKRREDARALADPRESIAQFLAAFAAQQQGVDDALKLLAEERQRQEEAAGTGAPPAAAAAASLQGRLDGLAAEVLSLEQSAAAASYYLPPYDQRQCAGAVAALRAAIDAARGALVPRKRFAFSSKKVSKVKGEQVSNDSSTAAASLAVASAAAATLSSQQQPLHDEPAAAAGDDAGGTAGAAAFGERDVALVAAGRGLMGLRDTVVIKRVEEVSGGGQGGQDFVLLGLTGCTVFLLGHLPALRMAGLRRCRVFAGPVTGACFLDDVRDSQLALASYQVGGRRRMVGGGVLPGPVLWGGGEAEGLGVGGRAGRGGGLA